MKNDSEEDKKKPKEKENVLGAWILFIGCLVIPALIKVIFFPDE